MKLDKAIKYFCSFLLGLGLYQSGFSDAGSNPNLLNDLHSRLNPSLVDSIHYPKSTLDVLRLIKTAKQTNKSISISGGQHSMGGQQYGVGTLHISMSKMNDVLSFDRNKGIVTVEAGIQWPELIDHLIRVQKYSRRQWGITQKQTGADRLSIGGALSSNVHGRGLVLQPMVQDVESFRLVNAKGKVLNVSRTENSELFSLVIGGYGLFGVITEVDVRLTPRQKIVRVVEVINLEDFPEKTAQRIADGYLYGDLQFKTDGSAKDFLKKGVYSFYKPVPPETLIPEQQGEISGGKWKDLIVLAHSDKAQVFDEYTNYYLSTDGQIYWTDTHQLGYYDENYESFLAKNLAGYKPGSLMISEVYVPREKIYDFMDDLSEANKTQNMDIIYGTVRLIKTDNETFLPWAKKDYACIVLNLRVEHTEDGIEKGKSDFRLLIDVALSHGGSYFLTYHKWARKDQLLEAYPQFPRFLKLKLKYDPEEMFQSDWYRFYKEMFSEN
ncbi:MAG: FAD-binding oxidoreductase [SAR86 cluster bacterium]|nr:FAD-binding oxidoreductase [SAR86 cluster bacterium]